MSDTQLEITLPFDEALAAQVKERLAPHADVSHKPPTTLSLEAIALIATIASIGSSIAGIAAARASIERSKAETLKTLLEIKQMLIAQGKAEEARIGSPTASSRSFAEADEPFLRQLLGIE